VRNPASRKVVEESGGRQPGIGNLRRCQRDFADVNECEELPRRPISSWDHQHGVWLYHRFAPSFRDVKELLVKRGIIVTHETVRHQILVRVNPFFLSFGVPGDSTIAVPPCLSSLPTVNGEPGAPPEPD
jgi:hypothetical protein